MPATVRNVSAMLMLIAALLGLACTSTGEPAGDTTSTMTRSDAELGSRSIDHATLPRVLILGDSISIGYTPYVRDMLAGEALVVRPMLTEHLAENCEGTSKGVDAIDRWVGDVEWDVIHFNFGLHDLKFVDDRGKNSNSPLDQRQADIDTYQENLRAIVERLQESDATLIFATTTPIPVGPLSPLRYQQDVPRYNEVARHVMEEHEIQINDLYAHTLPNQAAWQRPRNVHFHEEGSRKLAEQVAETIRQALAARNEGDGEGSHSTTSSTTTGR